MTQTWINLHLHHHHHHISVMELGHLLTRSGPTYPEFLQRSTMIPSASCGVVFHYPEWSISMHSIYESYVYLTVHHLDS